ncbi:hypothetical protein HPP92_018117, partial [Vanilla planifolia]
MASGTEEEGCEVRPAPIEASRQSLRNAYLLLTSESPVEDAGELRTLLNSAARDCVPRERNSFVCTFKLIVKNAASLLSNGDPIKLDAETRLDYLIRSLSLLGSTIDNSDLRMTSDREKVKNGLMNSISALDEFEQGKNLFSFLKCNHTSFSCEPDIVSFTSALFHWHFTNRFYRIDCYFYCSSGTNHSIKKRLEENE